MSYFVEDFFMQSTLLIFTEKFANETLSTMQLIGFGKEKIGRYGSGPFFPGTTGISF